MKLHQTTLIELDEQERATLVAAGDRWARLNTLCRYRTGRIKRVAKALGIGPETLRCWERGTRRPTWAKFERWCALLDVSELDLAGSALKHTACFGGKQETGNATGEKEGNSTYEIEITDAMINAGARACVMMGCVEEPESVAITVFNCMWEARNKDRLRDIVICEHQIFLG